MSEIYIVRDFECEETSVPDPEDRWERANTSTQHYIYGFEVDNGSFDLAVRFDPEFDVDYYLLFAVYSTGDTFGHDAGGNIEFLGLYEKDETAELNQKRVEAQSSMDEPEADYFHSTVTLLSDFGIDYDFYIPWFGYFESLDYITIETVRRKK